MSPADKIKVILLVKVFNDDLSESVRDASVILSPVNNIFLGIGRVRPKQVTEKSTIWNISRPKNLVNLLQVIQLGRQAAVDAEDLVVDDSRDRETVEALNKLLPELQRVASLALVVEAIDPVDGAALVVATEEEEVLGVLDLVGQEETDDFEVLLASVDVVSQEEVVRLRREVANLEDSEQIDVLAVDVACDDEGHVEFQQVWLADEDLLTLFNQHFDLSLGQVNRLQSKVRLIGLDVVSHLQEGVDDLVEFLVVHLDVSGDGLLVHGLVCLSSGSAGLSAGSELVGAHLYNLNSNSSPHP